LYSYAATLPLCGERETRRPPILKLSFRLKRETIPVVHVNMEVFRRGQVDFCHATSLRPNIYLTKYLGLIKRVNKEHTNKKTTTKTCLDFLRPSTTGFIFSR